jgi:hypothetical protein
MPPGNNWASSAMAVAETAAETATSSDPVFRQEFVNVFCEVVRQAVQHVGEPSLWIDFVELVVGHKGVDRSRTPAALIGGEGPVSSAYCDRL